MRRVNEISISILLLLGLILPFFLVSCKTQTDGKSVFLPASGEEEVVLRYCLADPQESAFWEEKIAEFRQMYPQVRVEIEAFRGTDEMFKALRIRQAARQLPDLMQLKPDFMPKLSRSLYIWPRSEAVVQENKFAADYAVANNVCGLPLRSYQEFIYYHKDIFEKCGVEIPDTWAKFLQIGSKIRQATGQEVIPLVLGARDAWTVYPFTEFMPHLLSREDHLLDKMTTQEHPFVAGSTWDESYRMVQELFRSELLDADALRTGIESAQERFETDRAAMIALGQWYLPNYLKRKQDLGDLGVFALPIRQNEDTKNPILTMVDNFLCVNAESKNMDLAKKFVEWSFHEDVYKEYLQRTMCSSTRTSIDVDLPLVSAYLETSRDVEKLYFPGGIGYQERRDICGFDCKAIGQWILAGKDYRQILDMMDRRWEEAGRQMEKSRSSHFTTTKGRETE